MRRRVGVRVVPAKGTLSAQQPGLREREKAPEIRESVFDRGAGENEPVLRRQRSRNGCDLAPGILDELTLIQYHGVPRLLFKPCGVESELRVVRDDES